MKSPVRRSNRARRQVSSYYDEAAEKERERRKQMEEKKNDDDDEDDDDDDNEARSSEEEQSADSSESDTEDSDDEDDENENENDASVSKPLPRTKKKTVTPNKRSPAVVKRNSNNNNKRAAPSKASKASKASSSNAGGGPRRIAKVASRTAFTKTRIAQALRMLSKSALNNHQGGDDDNDNDDSMDEDPEDETPEKSLVSALLSSARPVPGIPSTNRTKTYSYQQQPPSGEDGDYLWPRDKRTRAIVESCLPQLEGIARHLVKTTEHEGPHELHVKLLNLVFRSVGGSTRTNIPANTDLDELEDEDWDDIISKVVTVMKNESDADQTLLVSDGPGDDDEDNDNDGERNSGTLTTRQIGIRVYRTLYKEFWYRLGHVILAYSPSPAVAMVSEEDENENDDDSDSDSEESAEGTSDSASDSATSRPKKPKKSKPKKSSSGAPSAPQSFSSNRFQLEKVRDLILRVSEFVSVGQPDLRAAATLAVLQVARACVERTVELEQKIRVATRQLRAAVKVGSKRKEQLLQQHLDNWKRHKAELEEIVEGPVFQGVFIHRYRDTNDRIRRDCMRALSAISLTRPDLFLVDTYLKYFGWMASDKASCVRVAALEGLLAPFRAAGWSAPASSASAGSFPFPIDIRSMLNVTMKFLARIVDCTNDARSLRVQELATKLLLYMLRDEFLDDWEEDADWDKINLKALDALSSPRVRRDALYFVMDQLDAFDDGKDSAVIGEKKQLDRLVAIARWCANKLCDGSVPIDKMNIELADCLVESMRDMPEHKALVLNWPMMIKAIRRENPQANETADDREEVASQRILLRILATSAKHELGEDSQSEKSGPMMPGAASTRKRKKSSDPSSDTSLDQLSTALLKNLADLLDTFKSDVMSLRDVTKLPIIVTSSALSLPSQKTDFQNLVKSLCQLYLDSTDERTLQNIAQTLSCWVEGDHTRVSEVKMNLKRMSVALQDRLMELFRESDPDEAASRKSKASQASRRKSQKRRSSSQSSRSSSTHESRDMFTTSPETDTEHSISLLMLRWNILLMQCHAKYLFEKATEKDEDEIEAIFFTISEAMGKRLSDRMPTRDSEMNDDATTVTAPTVFRDLDFEVHEVVATSIQRALRVMLLIVSYELSDTLLERKEFENSETRDDDVEINEYNFPVLKLRDTLVKLLGLCFDQHLPNIEGAEYTNEQRNFANLVQIGAGQVASDLRTLFPFDWSKACDPVRQALALTNDEGFTILLSGFARWFQSREDSGEENEESDANALAREAILPLARVTNMNFDGFFRKEAAMIMRHISGSGSLAAQTVLSLSRTLKKTNPVRMLESQMACLRIAFESWLDSEPVIPDDTSPTEDEIQAFEEAEKRHGDSFASMEQVSSKLSSTLGVAGRLANDNLKKSIFGFVREGIRYSFDGADSNKLDDDLVVGSRLAFLLILSKYSIWIKKDKSHMSLLSDFLIEKESELHRHPEFEEVHEDDLKALADFKKSLGIKQTASNAFGNVVGGAITTDDRSLSAATTPSPSTAASGGSSRRGTFSALSKGSRTSRRSGISVHSELSPLLEEEDAENNGGDDDDGGGSDASPTPQKRRRLDDDSSHRADRSSVGSTITNSTHHRGTILEENEQEESRSGTDDDE